MKKLMIISFILTISTSAFANPVKDKINNTVNVITVWATNEKAETIAFQKKNWVDSKAQLNNTWLQIKNLFKVK